MRSLLRAGVLALVASLGSGVMGAPVAAQEVAAVDAALKSRVERRFRVLQVRDGLVLTPRREVRGAAVDRDSRGPDCRRRHAHDGRAVARATWSRRRPRAAGLVPVPVGAGRMGCAAAGARAAAAAEAAAEAARRQTSEKKPSADEPPSEHPLAQELGKGPHRQQHRRRRRRAGDRSGRRHWRQRHCAWPRRRRRRRGGRQRPAGTEGTRARRCHGRRRQRRTGKGREHRRDGQRSADRAAVQLRAVARLRRHVVRRLACHRRRRSGCSAP